MIELPTRCYRDEVADGEIILTIDPEIAKRFLMDECDFTEEAAIKKINETHGFVSHHCTKQMYRICYFINVKGISKWANEVKDTNLAFTSSYTNLDLNHNTVFEDRLRKIICHELAHLCMACIDTGISVNTSRLKDHLTALQYHVTLSEGKIYKLIRLVLDWYLGSNPPFSNVILPKTVDKPYIYFYNNHEGNPLPSYYVFEPNEEVRNQLFDLHPDLYLLSTGTSRLRVFVDMDRHQIVSVILCDPNEHIRMSDVIHDVISEMFLSVFKFSTKYVCDMLEIEVLSREKEEVLAHYVQRLMDYQLSHFYSAMGNFIKSLPTNQGNTQ